MYSYPPLLSFWYSVPYIVVLGVYWCVYLICDLKKYKQHFTYSHAVFFVLLIYFIFIGFRGYICTDWYNYYPMFHETPSLLNYDEFLDYAGSVFTEIGYLYYISLFKVFCNDYVIFQAFSVLIDLILIHICLKKYSANYLLSFVILSVFFYVQSVNLNRGVKSVLLFLYAIRYVEFDRIPFSCNFIVVFCCILYFKAQIFNKRIVDYFCYWEYNVLLSNTFYFTNGGSY